MSDDDNTRPRHAFQPASRIVRAGQGLDRLGFTPGSTGSLSVRLGPDRFAITPIGIPCHEGGAQG